MKTWADPGGDMGSRSPLKNLKNIGFPSNIDLDPYNYHKATKPAINGGSLSARKQNAFRWRGRWWPADSGICIIPPLIKLKKNVVNVGPPLTKLSGSAHGRYDICKINQDILKYLFLI